MIDRIKHSVNGVEFVPNNKDEFSLNVNFPDTFTEWENDFSTDNNVIMPQEAYLEMIRHFEQTGVQQMPIYTISIDGKNHDFFVDLYQNVRVKGSYMSVSVKKLDDKNNIKSLLDDTTFEYLNSIGKITNSHKVNIPFVVIPDDIGARMLNIATMVFIIGKEIIDTAQLIAERVGDLLSGTIPSAGFGVTWPLGNVARFAVLLTMDIAKLILLIVAFEKLVQQAFDLLLPPLRIMKAMTVDRLLTIALSHHNLSYNSSLKQLFTRVTVLPVPIDFQKKKFFDMLLGADDRVLNRGYPTSSDTVPTAGRLIEEICKIFNINPKLVNGVLVLEPKKPITSVPNLVLDNNFALQDEKEIEKELDLSKLWNTKILSYQNDSSDKLLFDNPKGLRVEYKSVPSGAPANDLTIIKGYEDIRFSFALGTIKKETKLDEFLRSLAKASDKLLDTSFTAILNMRKGVLAISQDQFTITKLIYQIGGKQTSDYLSHIGAPAVYNKYHKIDESRNNLFLNTPTSKVRMNNDQFNEIIQDNLISLEGITVEVLSCVYTPESSIAEISYRESKLEWSQNIKTIKIYEE